MEIEFFDSLDVSEAAAPRVPTPAPTPEAAVPAPPRSPSAMPNEVSPAPNRVSVESAAVESVSVDTASVDSTSVDSHGDSAPTASATAAPARSADEMRTLLAPSSVARSSFVISGSGPSQPSAPAGTDVGQLRPLTEAEAERLHGDYLRDRAMARDHLSREPFELHRQRDGSYHYEGHLFVGVVRPDGTVAFRERDAATVDLMRGTGTWDFNDLMQGAQGGNPRSAEEARFMRETEALRLRLEREHHARELDVARRRLRGRLRTAWAAPGPAATRRAAIFRLWDAFPEDGSAGVLRAAVLTFVRVHLPLGASDAYSVEELRQLNSGRESRAAFAPY